MPDSWKFDVAAGSLIAADLHTLAIQTMSQGQLARSAPPIPNVSLFHDGERIDPDRVEQKSLLVHPDTGLLRGTPERCVPQLVFSAKVDGHSSCTVELPGVYHLSKHFGFDLRDFELEADDTFHPEERLGPTLEEVAGAAPGTADPAARRKAKPA